VKNAIQGQPTLRFDGQRRFLQLAGQVVHFAIVSRSSPWLPTSRIRNAHREIFSNWNGSAGNATSSLVPRDDGG
jgi:hypothetical protein